MRLILGKDIISFSKLKVGAEHISEFVGKPLAEGFVAALNFEAAGHTWAEEATGVVDGDSGFVDLT